MNNITYIKVYFGHNSSSILTPAQFDQQFTRHPIKSKMPYTSRPATAEETSDFLAGIR